VPHADGVERLELGQVEEEQHGLGHGSGLGLGQALGFGMGFGALGLR
jgi:hypothetical protein